MNVNEFLTLIGDKGNYLGSRYSVKTLQSIYITASNLQLNDSDMVKVIEDLDDWVKKNKEIHIIDQQIRDAKTKDESTQLNIERWNKMDILRESINRIPKEIKVMLRVGKV